MVLKTLTESLIRIAENMDDPLTHDIARGEGTTALQIEHTDHPVPASPDVWRAWTGRRYVFGVEYHGPVYPLGKDETVPWTGARVCSCSTCQSHVIPTLRPN